MTDDDDQLAAYERRLHSRKVLLGVLGLLLVIGVIVWRYLDLTQ